MNVVKFIRPLCPLFDLQRLQASLNHMIDGGGGEGGDQLIKNYYL